MVFLNASHFCKSMWAEFKSISTGLRGFLVVFRFSSVAVELHCLLYFARTISLTTLPHSANYKVAREFRIWNKRNNNTNNSIVQRSIDFESFQALQGHSCFLALFISPEEIKVRYGSFKSRKKEF